MQISPVKSRLTQLGLLAAAVFGASAASAAPIENWQYAVTSVFADGTTVFKGAGSGNSNGCETVGANAISWGSCATDGARSSIGITDSPSSGIAVTNGAAVLANTYTHDNQSLSSAFATLATTKISAKLDLRVAGSNGAFTTKTASYDINFAETPNTRPCVVTSTIACNDIWVIRGSLNNSIIVGDDEYFFSFYAAPALTALSPAACNAVDVSSPCIGFTTEEGRRNEVSFMMRITSERITIPGEVPEPASIALLGAGLLGLAGMRARRQKNRA